VTAAERIAKLKRDIAQLRSRLQRIDHETHCGRQELVELEAGLVVLESEQGEQDG
jgi:hypothetical protein